jgi:hypothetical protein
MGVGSWAHAWADKRVGSLNSELRACKPEHVLRGGSLRQKRTGGESVPKHDEQLCVECWTERQCSSVTGGLLVLKVGLESTFNINLAL